MQIVINYLISASSDEEDFTLDAAENEAILSSTILPEEKAKPEEPTGNCKNLIFSLHFGVLEVYLFI